MYLGLGFLHLGLSRSELRSGRGQFRFGRVAIRLGGVAVSGARLESNPRPDVSAAYGYVEDLFPVDGALLSERDAARETGLEPGLLRRIWAAAGFPRESLDALSEDDVELLRRLAAVLDAGLPLVAFLQLVRVYGQALAHIADAEAKLNGTGRLVIRKSGTEPLIRVMAEGEDKKLVETMVDQICEAVRKAA